MTKFKTVWFWGENKEATETHNYVFAFFDDSHQKPSLVTDEKSPNHSFLHSFSSSDADGRYVVNFVDSAFDGVIDLWYVFIDARESTPPMRSIVAFANNQFPNGTVLSFEEAVDLGINISDSCGFIRWFKSDSRIQQVSVKEEYRRKRISTKLFGTADLIVVGEKNWNGNFLNGGDITTSDGEKLRDAWAKSKRVTPRVGSVENS